MSYRSRDKWYLAGNGSEFVCDVCKCMNLMADHAPLFGGVCCHDEVEMEELTVRTLRSP